MTLNTNSSLSCLMCNIFIQNKAKYIFIIQPVGRCLCYLFLKVLQILKFKVNGYIEHTIYINICTILR